MNDRTLPPIEQPLTLHDQAALAALTGLLAAGNAGKAAVIAWTPKQQTEGREVGMGRYITAARKLADAYMRARGE